MEAVTLLANGLPIATGTLSGRTVTFTINDILSASGNVTFTVVTGFSTAAVGTYQVSLMGAVGTNGQAVHFSGLPVTNSVVIETPTATVAPTRFAKPTCGFPYPNPVANGPVSVQISVPGTTMVKWSVFTLSFRKIVNGEKQVTQHDYIQWDLKDQDGKQVGDGLYYLRVEMNGTQPVSNVFKVLILR